MFMKMNGLFEKSWQVKIGLTRNSVEEFKTARRDSAKFLVGSAAGGSPASPRDWRLPSRCRGNTPGIYTER